MPQPSFTMRAASMEPMERKGQKKRARSCKMLLTMNICDDGVGFELNEQAQQGVGISSMQDRAISFGGRCIIEAAPSQGCSITITVPLKPEQGLV